MRKPLNFRAFVEEQDRDVLRKLGRLYKYAGGIQYSEEHGLLLTSGKFNKAVADTYGFEFFEPTTIRVGTAYFTDIAMRETNLLSIEPYLERIGFSQDAAMDVVCALSELVDTGIFYEVLADGEVLLAFE